MHPQRARRLLETSTSVAVLLLAIAGLSSLALNHFLTKPSGLLKPGLERGVALGQIPTIDYRNSPNTLLIALNTNCIYCQESLPFFKKLVKANESSNHAVRIVGIFPNKVEAVTTYIKQNGLLMETVSDVDLSRLKISGTPTMILLNSKGEIDDFWVGKIL